MNVVNVNREKLKKAVLEALANARDNGYGDDIDDMSSLELACDLYDLAPDVPQICGTLNDWDEMLTPLVKVVEEIRRGS